MVYEYHKETTTWLMWGTESRGVISFTVKVFYSHLKMSRRGVVYTCVRGQNVEVNEKKLMEWLSVKAPQAKDTTFTGDEMDKILLEGELGALFGKVLNDALGVLKTELEAVIETQDTL
ncbi:hypothetical protein K1719_000442 [Acacia pycnantha]|nr:hypothetical protein K1719_000442 [Acacia pycnantha]